MKIKLHLLQVRNRGEEVQDAVEPHRKSERASETATERHETERKQKTIYLLKHVQREAAGCQESLGWSVYII